MKIVKSIAPVKWEWTPQREQTASLLALGQLSETKIAAQVGVDRNTIWFWKQAPEFVAEIRSLADFVRASIMEEGIAVKANRIAYLNERHQRLKQIVDERAEYFASHEDPEVRDAPGVTTGLLIQQRRVVGTGRAATEIVEYVVDTALLRETRSLEEHTAREMGQWTDKSEVNINQKLWVGIDFDRI